MMFAARMMCALRHIGQTSHHCGTKWSNIIFAKQMHHIAVDDASFYKLTFFDKILVIGSVVRCKYSLCTLSQKNRTSVCCRGAFFFVIIQLFSKLGFTNRENGDIMKVPNKITYYLLRTYKTNSFFTKGVLYPFVIPVFANEFDKNANSSAETRIHNEFVHILSECNFVWRQIGVCVFWR